MYYQLFKKEVEALFTTEKNDFVDEVQANEMKEEEDVERGWLQAWAVERDWERTARALVIGGVAAVPGYRWFLWLSNSYNYRSKTLSLGIKVCCS